MKRAALERARTLRAWREHLEQVHGDEAEIRCSCEFQPGRFRKGERARGCPNARCYLCNFDKLVGIPSRRTWRSNISHHEWLEEEGFARPWRRRRKR